MPAMHPPALKSIRAAFFAGVIVLSPLAVTIFVFNWLVGLVGGNYRTIFFFFVPENWLSSRQLIPLWNFLATVIVLLLVTLLGYLSRYVATRFFFIQAERMMARVPLISAVYSTAKQIVDTFSAQRRAVFEKVVLIQFPRPGMWVIGFLTNRTRGEAQARTAEELWNVFIPTTPNPTSGYLVLVPKQDVIELEMSIGDGMKLIISGGSVTPPWPPPAVPVAPLVGDGTVSPSPATPPPPATASTAPGGSAPIPPH